MRNTVAIILCCMASAAYGDGCPQPSYDELARAARQIQFYVQNACYRNGGTYEQVNSLSGICYNTAGRQVIPFEAYQNPLNCEMRTVLKFDRPVDSGLWIK